MNYRIGEQPLSATANRVDPVTMLELQKVANPMQHVHFSVSLSLYIYICVCVYVYIYIYTYYVWYTNLTASKSHHLAMTRLGIPEA